ncbi:hypothetical protein V6617_13215 [Pelagibacterium nitratireducens]|mgnify:CR=1 FL=1|uniref:Anti-sigma factor n=1 Tax=Pelagibacterium nitratireducens TaxID=1046114 RepID=A0ABZ2HZC1_9HYPH|nr:hypothetical protein [Pelagibacterium sp.]HCO55969.1 hypothetical protein [Pelagibacterium sp.]|tara:strand:- start:6605 stop:7303 length:699 start_codon:yes stop_codon:yes gene_type:complete
MTESKEVTDEMLMAHIDGELDAATSRAIADAIAADPVLAERAQAFSASANAARMAFADILSAPPPTKLVEAVRDGSRSTVLPFPARNWVRAALPLAACVVLALGVGGGYLLGRGATPGPFSSTAEIASIIATAPAGVPTALENGQLTVLGSYPLDQGFCRSFAYQDPSESLSGVACDRGAGYQVELALAGGVTDGFAAASDGVSASIDAYLSSLGAGSPLGPDEEAERFGQF